MESPPSSLHSPGRGCLRRRLSVRFGTASVFLMVAMMGCQSVTEPEVPESEESVDTAVLLDMNRRLFETKILEQDPVYLRSVSDESYMVVAPGGVPESREQLISDLWAFSTVDSIRIENERVLGNDRTAVVLNRLVIHGPIQGPLGEIGPVTVMTVFTRRDEGRWMVVSRAYSRCDPGAVAVGIC